jgi:hypothetical protein
MRKLLVCALATASFAAAAEIRLSNDVGGGYTSMYTLATGVAYTDAVITECGLARGRQNEPSVAMNPRNPLVLVGSSNDYCGTYAGSPAGTFIPAGPIWLGYYRSENGGTSFVSSLVPGYPGDTSPYSQLAKIRTASSGDPVIAWDNHGRLYMGSESSEDPSGSKKGWGDLWVARFDNPQGEAGASINDGKRFLGAGIVARGSSSPLTGKFNDKTVIQADRTGGSCDGNVYFAWSRFTGVDVSNIYFSRSTDHGATWSSPILVTSNTSNVQDPEITVTGNGHVYVSFDQGETASGQPTGIGLAKSENCGKTFAKPVIVATYTASGAVDIAAPVPAPAPTASLDDPLSEQDAAALGSLSRDCGDFASACQSGFTFFRRDSSTRSAADQKDTQHEYIYFTFDAAKPGTEVDTGTTYGTIRSGRGAQSAVFFVRYDGATGTATTPHLIDNQAVGHQFFSAISADGGILHALWWDSRNDPSYSAALPIGDDAFGHVHAALDVYATNSSNGGATWTTPIRVTGASTNPNFEQFSDRTVPFAGDYLWVTSVGTNAFGAWTDWRNTVPGTDPRELGGSGEGADVKQCRTFSGGAWSGDQCPHDGGIDQDIYGAVVP